MRFKYIHFSPKVEFNWNFKYFPMRYKSEKINNIEDAKIIDLA